LTFISLQNIF